MNDGYTNLTAYCRRLKLPRKETKDVLVRKGWITDDNQLTDLGAKMGLRTSISKFGETIILFPELKLNEVILPIAKQIEQMKNQNSIAELRFDKPLPPFPNKSEKSLTLQDILLSNHTDFQKYKKFRFLTLLSTTGYNDKNVKTYGLVQATILKPDGTEEYSSIINPGISVSAFTEAASGINDSIVSQDKYQYAFYDFLKMLDTETLYISGSASQYKEILRQTAKYYNCTQANRDLIENITILDILYTYNYLFKSTQPSLGRIGALLDIKTDKQRHTSYDALELKHIADRIAELLSDNKNVTPTEKYKANQKRDMIENFIRRGITDINELSRQSGLTAMTVKQYVCDLVERNGIDPQLFIPIETEHKILVELSKFTKWDGMRWDGVLRGQFDQFFVEMTIRDPKSRIYFFKKFVFTKKNIVIL